jgi:hypothetical protein
VTRQFAGWMTTIHAFNESMSLKDGLVAHLLLLMIVPSRDGSTARLLASLAPLGSVRRRPGAGIPPCVARGHPSIRILISYFKMSLELALLTA